MARLWTKPSRRWRSRIPTMQQTPLIPAKAGIQGAWSVALGPRFRGDERKVWLRLLWTKPSRIWRSRTPTMQQNSVHSRESGESRGHGPWLWVPRFRGDERKVWLRLRALALVAAMREASATNLQGGSHGLRPRSIRVGLPR